MALTVDKHTTMPGSHITVGGLRLPNSTMKKTLNSSVDVGKMKINGEITHSNSLALSTKSLSASTITFHPFRKLCAELREMIWILSLPDARVVEVVWDTVRRRWISPPSSSHRPSALLRVNQESRELYLKRCFQLQVLSPSMSHRSLSAHFRHDDVKVGGDVAYFNPKIDTLYISSAYDHGHALCLLKGSRIEKLASKADLAKVQHMAMSIKQFKDIVGEIGEHLTRLLSTFVGLQRFVVTRSDDRALVVCNYYCQNLLKPTHYVTLHDSSRQMDNLEHKIHQSFEDGNVKVSADRCLPSLRFLRVMRGRYQIKSEYEMWVERVVASGAARP